MMNVKVLSNQNYYMILWKVILDRHRPSVRWETGLCSLWVDGTKEMYLLYFSLFIWRKPLDQLICSFWNWRQSITEGICRLTLISAPTSLYEWPHAFYRFWFSVQQLIIFVEFFLCQVFSFLQMIISFFLFGCEDVEPSLRTFCSFWKKLTDYFCVYLLIKGISTEFVLCI